MRFVHLSKWTRAALALSTVVCGGLALSASFVPLTACTTESCEGAFTNYSGGETIDPDTWESNPIDGKWLPYTPELTIIVSLPQFAGRTALETTAYISPVEEPNKPPAPGDIADNSTTASGNLAEFQLVENHPVECSDGSVVTPAYFGMSVHNDTCAQYFVRVVAHFIPVDGGAGVNQNSCGEDPGVADASADASLDAQMDAAPDATNDGALR